MIEQTTGNQEKVIIKVIGIGGCGRNVIAHFKNSITSDVDLIFADSDRNELSNSEIFRCIDLDSTTENEFVTETGELIDICLTASVRKQVSDLLSDTQVLFIVGGMGGNTATNFASVIADVARNRGVFTISLVCSPFRFEGRKRTEVAEHGIKRLREKSDAVIAISNNCFLSERVPSISLLDYFRWTNNAFLSAFQSVNDLFKYQVLTDIDITVLRREFSNIDISALRISVATNIDNARKEIKKSMSHPKIAKIDFNKKCLAIIAAGSELTLAEIANLRDFVNDLTEGNAVVGIYSDIESEFKCGARFTFFGENLSQG